ncbi:TetR/AcrR family transcriptional regulator [Dactylosporangium sp. CA-092794]|uniref:TetR/AcrR family transcriptional regulator n=1 Tax=Dactylosporangium sp. CA-092794 TaxID=3239929 RepID=UPI003D919C97
MARPVGEPAFEDLTARARIRDAAIRLFAERGMDGTTVRDIARAAGVSPGLLRHHFGSKEALREECDRYVVDQSMKIKEQLILEDQVTSPSFLPSQHPTILVFYKYFTRALLDGSSRAAGLFDDMVVIAERWIAKNSPEITEDPRAFAAVLIGMQSGLLAMHDHVSRALGADIFSPEGHVRMIGALTEFYSHPLLDTEFVTKARQALQALRAANPPTAPGTDPGAEGA